MMLTCVTPPTAGPPSRRHSLKLLAPRPRVERGCPAAAPRVEWGGPATAAAPRVHGGAPPSPSTALLNSIPGNSTHTGNYMRAVAPSQSPSQIAWVDPLSTSSVAWGQLRRCCCSGAARSAAARERRDLLPSLHNLGQRRGLGSTATAVVMARRRGRRDRSSGGPSRLEPGSADEMRFLRGVCTRFRACCQLVEIHWLGAGYTVILLVLR